jgi:hypothetical protein
VQIAAAPDGSIPDSALVAGKFLPLQSGVDGLSFDVITATRGGNVCYTNAVRLDGQAHPALCKSGGLTPSNDPAKNVEDLKNTCARLATERIDGVATADFYARYADGTNRLSCTCVNGRVREVLYATFASRLVSDFESECKRKVDPATDGETGEQQLAALRRACSVLATGRASVICSDADAICGARSKKRLAFDDYRGYANLLKVDCLREVDLDVDDAPIDTALGRLQRQCRQDIPGAALSADKTGCDCPNAGRLTFSAYTADAGSFAASCQ